MAHLDRNKTVLDPFRGGKNNLPTKHLSFVEEENEYDVAFHPREEDMDNNGYRAADDAKRLKLREDGNSTLQKLEGFFEIVQKQHPESRLELQQVDGNWRVWCGACKKLLRPDKSGKAIQNIQRQHFTSARHRKKLHLMLQAEEEEAENQRKGAAGKGSGIHDNEYR